MALIIFRKLDRTTANKLINMANKFFKENPKRKICRTDLFDIRRGHVTEDINRHSEEEK